MNSPPMPIGAISCPIWGTVAYPIAGYERRDGMAVFSPRAGGRFFISRTAEVNLKNGPIELKVKLTHEIADHNLLGSMPEITSHTLDGLEQVAKTKPADRAKRLLTYLVSRSTHLGLELSDHRYLEWLEVGDTTYTDVRNQEADRFLAWSDSTDDTEVIFLLKMLAENKAIQIGNETGIPSIVVLPAGYDLVENVTDQANSDQAFIAMWFDASMDDAYENGIDPGVRDAGFRPLRIDRKEHTNKIDDEIISEIRKSRFLIADFTSSPNQPRGGVYFEAGFALALGKPVVWCCRSDCIEQVHFDTRQFNHIVWSHPAELRSKLKNRIGAILGPGPFRQHD